MKDTIEQLPMYQYAQNLLARLEEVLSLNDVICSVITPRITGITGVSYIGAPAEKEGVADSNSEQPSLLSVLERIIRTSEALKTATAHFNGVMYEHSVFRCNSGLDEAVSASGGEVPTKRPHVGSCLEEARVAIVNAIQNIEFANYQFDEVIFSDSDKSTASAFSEAPCESMEEYLNIINLCIISVYANLKRRINQVERLFGYEVSSLCGWDEKDSAKVVPIPPPPPPPPPRLVKNGVGYVPKNSGKPKAPPKKP